MNVAIEPARLGDHDALLALLAAQMREHDIALTDEALARNIAAVLADPARGCFFTARDDEAVVGVAYASYARPLELDGEAVWLEELFVSPSHRERKIGERLLAAVVELARARAAATVDLEIEATHERASHLYHRHGFRPHTRAHWTLRLR